MQYVSPWSCMGGITGVQRKTAVTAYFTSEQLLLFSFTDSTMVVEDTFFVWENVCK